MKIAFLDPIRWDYVVETPRLKPLGGSQSALCYLAEELVRLGHEVALMNATSTPGRSRGVECLRFDQVPMAAYARYDALVALNVVSPDVPRAIRAASSSPPLTVLWSQHNHDQPAVRELADRAVQDSWDEFVLVSEWQAKGYREVFGLDPARIRILGNAIGPAFENLYPEPGAVAAQKPWPPVLCYTSTPFRGLDVLLKAFPRIRAAIPGARLRVFSSMSVYGVGAEQDPFGALYAQCRATEGVEYVGSVSQVALAEALRGASCLAYPNTFAEGFCIAVLEAMAAGCVVITSDLGALRDTTAGFGHLLVPHPDKERHAELYAEFAVRVLKAFHASPEARARLGEQVLAVNRTGTWPVRAREWEAWLSAVVGKRKALQSVPPPSLEEAAAHYRAGRFHEAETACREILRRQPAHAKALYLRGLIELQRGRTRQAVDLLQAAVRSSPSIAAMHSDLGSAAKKAGNLKLALASYRRAIELQPDLFEAYNNLGALLRESGDLAAAESSYRRALQINPDLAEAHGNLGNLLASQGRLVEAKDAYRRAVDLRPDDPELQFRLGETWRTLGRGDLAVPCYQKTLQLAHEHFGAYSALGTVLIGVWSIDKAIIALEAAERLEPNAPEVHGNLGTAFLYRGELDKAVVHYRRAIALNPGLVAAHSNLLLALNYDCALAPEALLEEHKRFAERYEAPILERRCARRAAVRDGDPERRLRIGYVSPDLHDHPVARFFEPILEHHDRQRVGVFCYGLGGGRDATTDRLESMCDGWRANVGMTDEQIADQIRADQIDILVDLAGHTRNNRLLVFARRPAPVQIAFLGYPNTTGLSSIDYVITDSVLDPPEERALYTERPIRLPLGFCPFRPSPAAPAVAPLPALRSGALTFGSVHTFAKLNDAVLDLWCEVLRAVPSSRLLIYRHTLTPSMQMRVHRMFESRGIAPKRIALHQALDVEQQFFGGYAMMDVLLDTFPFCGHTTTCESLWMGVPVLTLYGNRRAGRMSASVLTQAGLPDWIADTPREYLELAAKAAGEIGRLAELRRDLRRKMSDSALCDCTGFTRALEFAYRDAWRAWCAKAR